MKTKKKKFDVYGTVTGGKYLGTVEAESAEEALDIAYEGKKVSLSVDLCHQCASECENAEVSNLTVEESTP